MAGRKSKRAGAWGVRADLWLAFAGALCVLVAAIWGPKFQAGYRPFAALMESAGVVTGTTTSFCQRTKAGSTKFRLAISYSYRVNGLPYTGSAFSHDGQCLYARAIDDAKAYYRPGMAIPLFYNASRPAYSVLDPDSDAYAEAAIASALASLFFVVALLGWRAASR